MKPNQINFKSLRSKHLLVHMKHWVPLNFSSKHVTNQNWKDTSYISKKGLDEPLSVNPLLFLFKWREITSNPSSSRKIWPNVELSFCAFCKWTESYFSVIYPMNEFWERDCVAKDLLTLCGGFYISPDEKWFLSHHLNHSFSY